MPERPKRRKNNRNKRKNNKNKPDSSNNSSDLNEVGTSETCCSSSDNQENLIENKEISDVADDVIIPSPQISEANNVPSTSLCVDSMSLPSEDFNNNDSNRSEVLNRTLFTVEHVQNNLESLGYVVETPDQGLKNKPKLKSDIKSKSLDNDDDTKIVELTDDDSIPANDCNLDVVDTSHVIITDVESDVEWEKTDDFNNEKSSAQEPATGSLTITTLPLDVAQCDQTKCLTFDEEKSLRNFLKTLNLSSQPESVDSIEIKTEIEQIINREMKHRLRKKGLAEDFITLRPGPPRMLDVIDEEGSSESSMTSRRQSYLSERKSDVEDLEDDVFEDTKKIKTQNTIKQTKMPSNLQNKSFGRLVPQECVLVGAKIKEPEISEARGDWSMKTVEKMTGAEIVYLTDTSSSTSSIHEVEDEDDGIETDVSVRIITPTIEVTDTENLLKKTFVSNIKDDLENNINASTPCGLQMKFRKELEKGSHQCNRNDTVELKHIVKDVETNSNKSTEQPDAKNNTKSEHIIKIECENVPNKVGKCTNNNNEYSKRDSYGESVHQVNKQIEEEKTSGDKISSENIQQRAININENNQSQYKDTEHSMNAESGNISIKHDLLENNKQTIKKQSEILFNNNVIENIHEIVVLSTDNIKTNLHVKEICKSDGKDTDTDIMQDDKPTLFTNSSLKKLNEYDLQAKIIKCEFNDAINNLIKEVSSDTESCNENIKETFSRHDSSSSACSSQCTAKYNPTYSSLNDVSNIHEEFCENMKLNTNQISSTTSHVKDVFEYVTDIKDTSEDVTQSPLKLRDICVKKITLLPYGEKILEELASVSQRLQNITNIESSKTNTRLMLSKNHVEKVKNTSYILPDVSSLEKIHLPIKDTIPPPVKPRHSSLRNSLQEDGHSAGVPANTEPVYICLSPSQKMLMEKTNTVVKKEQIEKKIVDRGYDESYKKQNHKNENNSENPFKSQTGSRLFALIRDPNLTRNIHSLNQRLNNSLDDLQKYNFIPKFSNEKLNSVRDYPIKPIPPPRPRKISTSFYESDESSDFTDNSMRSMKSERKFFHYSTGNLNKEIENDISSIQNMHRFHTNPRDESSYYEISPRRPSLPKDLCEQQMEYIRKKEKEVEAELQRLEVLKNKTHHYQKMVPKAPLISEKETRKVIKNHPHNYTVLQKRDLSSLGFNDKKGNNESDKITSLFSSSQEELLREKMYSEYVTQMAERNERKHHKIIKITDPRDSSASQTISKSLPTLDILESKINNRIEKEFISKAKERWEKLGIKDPETEDERDSNKVYKEPKVIEHKIKVIEGGEEKDVQKLPSHLQEFVRFTAKDTDKGGGSSVVWRPGAPAPPSPGSAAHSPRGPPPPPLPVWAPDGAGASPHAPRKSFRPVQFEESPPARRNYTDVEQNGGTGGSEGEGRLRTSHSAPAAGLHALGGSPAGRLPRAQNPTVTLLQKAREGQIPRGASYLQQEKDAARLPRDRPSPPRGDPVHALRKEYASEGEADGRARAMAGDRRRVDGIGPVTKDGMPVTLRSEVKDPSRWYKRMYDTIHRHAHGDDYVTVRYRSGRGEPPERATPNKSQYAYFDPRSGYLSEPEGRPRRAGGAWSDAPDGDVVVGPRRRTASVQEERRTGDGTPLYAPTNKYSTLASARASHEVYKNQPGRIENYVPGRSSAVDREAKQWWDEVMDIFDGQHISSTTSLPQASPNDKKDLTTTILSKSNMARALKESGYESDSTLVFRRREETEAPLSPAERRAAYRDLQAGGEPPLRGFRSPAPPRQESDSAPEPPRRTSRGSCSDTECPRRYVESDVNIHYRCPVRQDPLPLVPEQELARQQAEHMQRLYRDQKRSKYLQELQDTQSRRHQDHFTPSQKSVVPLNRYDETERGVARALYSFTGQTPRELSFRRGDLIHVRRPIDSNWCEGELRGRTGLFPRTYVQFQKGDVVQAPKRQAAVEGRARAKFDFTAQTSLELPLKKGEVVTLTRRIDQNWWEGRSGAKTGIFPDSYVTVLQEPSQHKPEVQQVANSEKPVASPAAHGLLNGSARSSMGAHRYTPQPNSAALANAPPATQPLPGHAARPAHAASERGAGLNNTEPLYVDTNAEAVPYRAMYKYRPQNPDELELSEGDTVYVLEQCDDGWYVGSSQRTGRFGTFPGNYVERI